MANYIGVQCPVCEKRFVDGDDVVVCPICGAPHHRACYQQLGKCALDDHHAPDYAWENPSASAMNGTQDAHAQQTVVCAVCKTSSPSHCLFCQTCGARLDRQNAVASSGNANPGSAYTPPVINAYTMAFGGLSPTEELNGVSVRDLAIFVGPSAHYFLPQFKMLALKGGPSVNLPSIIFSFFYFFYRKMYGIGALFLGLVLLSFSPMLLVMPELVQFIAEHFQDILLGINVFPLFQPQSHLWVYQINQILQYVPFIFTVLFSFFANRIYFSFAVKQIKKCKEKSKQASTGELNDHDYGLLLAKRGRISMLVPVLVLVALTAGYFLLSFYYFTPHQDMLISAFTKVMGQ